MPEYFSAATSFKPQLCHFKKEIKARLDIELPEVEKLLDSLQDISDKVTKVVNQNDEITAYLFHPLGSQDSTPAEAILQFYGDFSEQDPLRIQAGVLTAFHCNPLNFLYTTLDNYNLLYTGSGEKSLKGCGLLKLMESCSLCDQDKWRLLAFYHDFEAYLDQFIKALSKAIEVFLPFIPSLAVWIEPFYKRFPKEINNETLYRYMAEKSRSFCRKRIKFSSNPLCSAATVFNTSPQQNPAAAAIYSGGCILRLFFKPPET